MSGAIRTMAGQQANATGARRASGRTASGMCTYAWSADSTANVVATAIAPIPVFAGTKLHARRPKEASQ